MNALGAPAGCRAGRLLSPRWWAPALRQGEPAGPGGAPPAWAAITEQAIAAAAAAETDAGAAETEAGAAETEAGAAEAAAAEPASWQEAFAVPLRPFEAAVRERVARAASRHLAPGHADPVLIGDTFAAAVGRRLARIAAHAIASALDDARTRGELTGSDSRERFATFLRRQSTPAGLASLFGEHPVLARLLGGAVLAAADAGAEMLARLAADRAEVVDALLGGADPGPAVAVEPGLGDRHRGGRSVTAVSFADGRAVVYKPRDVGTLVGFGEMIGWLNRRVPGPDLRPARAVAKPGYGWLELVASEPLARRDDAAAFYFREGLLLAVLHTTRAADIHCENIVASGDQPVVVDAETLFHPALPGTPALRDPAARALAESVCRTALLPFPTFHGEDVWDQSGMGGGAGEISPGARLDWDRPGSDEMRLARRPAPPARARNRPHLAGEPLAPADYEMDVLEGFRLGYDAIARERRAFAGLIGRWGDVETRVVLRPTGEYARALDESTRPQALRDAQRWEQALGAGLEAPGHHRLWRLLAPCEAADLRAGDIPLVTARPAARDLWTSDRRRLPRVLGEAALEQALGALAAMSEVGRSDQEWVISASLATRRPLDDHRDPEPMAGPVTAASAEPSRLLATACGLADQIIARGKTGGDGHRVNWLGLQLVEDARWLVMPMGASLAQGYLGVALFLAQLAELTGIDRYAREARKAVSHVPELWDVLRGRPELLAAVGCGASEGLGGISYGLARMATLLGDGEVGDWARTAVDLAAAAARLPGPAGWADGKAGCLAAMSAVAAELGSAQAGRLAASCADELAASVREAARSPAAGDGLEACGFANGPAGIGWALARHASASAAPLHARAAMDAIRQACALPGESAPGGRHGWCRGLAGMLIARSCLTDGDDARQTEAAVERLARRPVPRDLSLCHGEAGIAEALTVLASRSATAQRAKRRRAGLLLGALSRDPRCCGTPGGVWTPGLLTGTAGIGYELLRLGFAEQVPSALLLEPTPPDRRRHRP